MVKDESLWRKAGPVIVGGGIIVIALAILCRLLGFCWWCPTCPQAPDCDCSGDTTHGSLVLEDTHAALWMAFENSFELAEDASLGDTEICDEVDTEDLETDAGQQMAFGLCDGRYSSYFRAGVLVQVGGLGETAGSVAEHFGGITLRLESGETVEIGTPDAERQFDWLDIRPQGSDECVVDPLHAYALFQNELVTTECDDVIAGSKDDCGSDEFDCDGTAFSTCLRNRSLHAGLQPTKALTYWPGEDYYEVVAGPVEEDAEDTAEAGTHSHVMYTIEFKDPVIVDRWLNGCFEERHGTDEVAVNEIRVLYKEDSAHHSYLHQPPMDGGIVEGND